MRAKIHNNPHRRLASNLYLLLPPLLPIWPQGQLGYKSRWLTTHRVLFFRYPHIWRCRLERERRNLLPRRLLSAINFVLSTQAKVLESFLRSSIPSFSRKSRRPSGLLNGNGFATLFAKLRQKNNFLNIKNKYKTVFRKRSGINNKIPPLWPQKNSTLLNPVIENFDFFKKEIWYEISYLFYLPT